MILSVLHLNDIKIYPNIKVFWSSCPSLFKNKITDISYSDFHKKGNYKINFSLSFALMMTIQMILTQVFLFVGGKINKNIWYNVYCYNPLQLKRNPTSQVLCCAIKGSDEEDEEMYDIGLTEEKSRSLFGESDDEFEGF